ncbi:methionine-R-sulfoxide reductase B1 isoform X4 [Nasonia vitripennis]|uniref:peptide-methionine (R)-S-oxide reductase n=1 Tax=Nasonia vitripennis TaxID=7425 RepID=A0A7M7QDP8_NASVI|nr:methionine-R-sulfoxide reductase B1 isoform X4 [Nasonia vitripennis]
MSTNVCKDDLKIRLTPIQWYVTQEKGTERPFSGCYNKFNGKGTYCCIVCEQELFSSKTKYDSGCGWPAFNEVLDQGRVKLIKDTSLDPQDLEPDNLIDLVFGVLIYDTVYE